MMLEEDLNTINDLELDEAFFLALDELFPSSTESEETELEEKTSLSPANEFDYSPLRLGNYAVIAAEGEGEDLGN